MSASRRDHPRLRGEKNALLKPQAIFLGSPPPTRGKGRLDHQRLGLYRITPAYAGKRSRSVISSIFVRDHPRLRGEKSPPDTALVQPRGSPPPTRGKVDVFENNYTALRITPAYAGKRPCPQRPSRRSWDHPRLRGEKTKNLPFSPNISLFLIDFIKAALTSSKPRVEFCNQRARDGHRLSES